MNAAPQKSPSTLGRSRMLRRVGLIVLAILLLPYLLTPLYLLLQPTSTPMLWRRITGAHVQQVWMPLDRMSPALPIAVLVAEDAQFCNHYGIDWTQVREAIDRADDFADA